MKSVILVGRGPSWRDCPFDGETWGVLSCYGEPELRDKHFDKVFAFDKLDEEIESNLKVAKEKGTPVVSLYPYATEQYPLKEVLSQIYSNGYLQNSICYMIAMAILRGYERIRLYGIDQYRGVYLLQKGSVEFWCGIAIGRGIKVEVAQTSMLLSEYLREVASVCGDGDDQQFSTLQEVMPFRIESPIIAMPMPLRPETKAPLQALFAFYDLEIAPATYDILAFLVLAEKKRLELGVPNLNVVIVPGQNRFRHGDLEAYQADGDYDFDYMEWRLKNILVPCCWLIPNCSGVTVCGDRNEADGLIKNMDGFLFPPSYRVAAPVERHLLGHLQAEEGELPSLSASQQAKRYVKQWLKENTDGRKVVTINLRETSYEPDRNSNLKAWKKFYWKLDLMGYCPLLIPDMEKSFRANGFKSYPAALWNIELRLALYELSYLNLFVNTGPAMLALRDKNVSCLVFKWLTPTSGATSARFFRANGLEVGEQLKWTTPNQRIIWEEDSLPVIEKEFKIMVDSFRTSVLGLNRTEVRVNK